MIVNHVKSSRPESTVVEEISSLLRGSSHSSGRRPVSWTWVETLQNRLVHLTDPLCIKAFVQKPTFGLGDLFSIVWTETLRVIVRSNNIDVALAYLLI